MTRQSLAVSAVFVLASSVLSAQTDVTPNLSGGVGSFYTDRYNPASFAVNPGIVQGRNNVLQIAINSSTNASNRPTGQQSNFYNTQGKKLDVNQTGSWKFQSDLFIESGWNTTSTLVRTDMWATQCNGLCIPNSEANVTDYPIIGFTNEAGAARFRGWDRAVGWRDFTSTVNFGAWNTLMMSFDAADNTFSYWVNGNMTYTFGGNGVSTVVGNVMYQARNFNGLGQDISNGGDYTANWSNTSNVVPEPSTYALMATGLIGLVGIGSRRRKNMPV
jgi:hypothetical protein